MQKEQNAAKIKTAKSAPAGYSYMNFLSNSLRESLKKALELYEKHAKMTRKHGKMSVIRKKQVKNKKK